MSDDPRRLPIPDGVRNAVLTGVVLGVVAALVVWWLERFEVNRLHVQVADYLRDHAAFEQWRRERGTDGG